jgi:hypothetical protein
MTRNDKLNEKGRLYTLLHISLIDLIMPVNEIIITIIISFNIKVIVKR